MDLEWVSRVSSFFLLCSAAYLSGALLGPKITPRRPLQPVCLSPQEQCEFMTRWFRAGESTPRHVHSQHRGRHLASR